jgi:hypothetical protein
VDLRWYTPPLFVDGLRPFVWVGNELTSFQRGDLSLEILYRNRSEGSLNVGYEPLPGLTLSGGGGVEEKILFGIDQRPRVGSTEPLVPIEGFDAIRPFAHANLEFVFNLDEIRRDRLHLLELESRHYWMPHESAHNALYLFYRKVFGFGWNDFEVDGRGAYLFGNVERDVEEPVGGRYVRGLFGDRFYVKRVAAVAAEVRWSLVRDLYKLGLFHDVAVFGVLDRRRGGDKQRVANAFGPGFHALILDIFQLNLYYSFGFCSDGTFDNGFSGSISKAF